MSLPFLTYDPNQKVFQIWISMGSQNKVKGRENIDDYKTLLDHLYPLKTRREIGALRQEINRMVGSCCITYYSAKFTNEVGLGQLRDACIRIDREMKSIDPKLYCEIKSKEEVFGMKQNTSFYSELMNGLRRQIIETCEKRLTDVIERDTNIKPKTRNSLLKMCDELKSLNIVNSPEINQEIDQIRQRIVSSNLREVRDDLLEMIETSKDRSTALEIVDPITVKSEPEKQKPKIDQSKVILDIL